MQTKRTIDEPNYFGELLRILKEEELIRFRRRFEKANNNRMAEIMTDELEERKIIVKTHGKDDRAF
jgi:hypothetical protein